MVFQVYKMKSNRTLTYEEKLIFNICMLQNLDLLLFIVSWILHFVLVCRIALEFQL